MVAVAVDGGREAGADGADAAVDVGERQVLRAAARRVRPDRGRRVRLGARVARGEPGHPGGQHERPVGADERLGQGLDRGALGPVRLRRVRPVVLVREVDDPLGVGGAAAQRVEVVEVAAQDRRALRLERGGRGVGAGEPDDLVSRARAARRRWRSRSNRWLR